MPRTHQTTASIGFMGDQLRSNGGFEVTILSCGCRFIVRRSHEGLKAGFVDPLGTMHMMQEYRDYANNSIEFRVNTGRRYRAVITQQGYGEGAHFKVIDMEADVPSSTSTTAPPKTRKRQFLLLCH